ncbi:MAG TPA: PAS domain S-box protein [Candidatus Acidoferrales bacterium]|jgi:PAS domain S-box-containing protein|nr:PAS domain S-box protein [Candidatus Acidoferrales bacterium]
MANDRRRLGIGIADEIPWGTHFCHFYETKEDLFDILIPYFKTGLEDHEFCMWVVFDPLDETGAKRALEHALPGAAEHLAARDIEIVPHAQWYLEDGAFDLERVLRGWDEKLTQALARGYSGMRVNGRAAWLTETDRRNFVAYENELNQRIADRRMIALCTYPLAATGAARIFDVAHTHQFAIAKQGGAWEVVETSHLRHAAEQALGASEERFRRYFELGLIGMAITSPSKGWIEVNDQICEILGYQRSELLQMSWADITHPEDLEADIERFNRVLAGEIDGYSMDKRFIRQDGRVIYASISVKCVRRGDGSVDYMVGLLQDITERKRAEDAQRASEERWRAIFENSAVGISLAGPDGLFTVSNRAYQEMVGYTDEELRPMSFLDITYEEDRSANLSLVKELWEGKRSQFQHEKRYRRKDGRLIWVRYTVSLAPGTETAPQFAMGIVEDITARKVAEEQLRRSEAYLAESQRLSHIGSWAMKISPRETVFWSPELYRIFGFDPAQGAVPFQAAHERIHAEDRGKVEQVLESAIHEGRDFTCDYRIVLPEGTVKHCRGIGHPVVNEAGEPVEFIGTVIDVTETRHAEEELQNSLEQLRALAARVQSAREEERTRVAREIHDELGQALTAIKLDVSSLIHDLPPDRKQEKKAESILALVDRTIQFVRRLSAELRPGMLDDLGLVAALEWAAEEFETRTGTMCRLDQRQNDIVMDRGQGTAIFRIFQETLTNVARHAGATQVDVRLTKDDGYIELEVRDNGRGIAKEQLSAGGLGILGMRERAILLGGEFTIEGMPGQGTLVRVRIPEAAPNRANAGASQ